MTELVTQKRPRMFLRKRSRQPNRPESYINDTKDEVKPNSGTDAPVEPTQEKRKANMISPRVGKLAFEMARSESRKNLDLNVKLFQRQSLLLAVQRQIEGDKQTKLLEDVAPFLGENITNRPRLPKDDNIAGFAGEENHNALGEVAATEKGKEKETAWTEACGPLGPVTPSSTRNSCASKGNSLSASNSLSKLGDSLGGGIQKLNLFPTPRRPSRQSHFRSVTLPNNDFEDVAESVTGGFSFRMGFRNREASSVSQPTPRPRTASGATSTDSGSGHGRNRSNSNTGACATMADFALPRVPDDMEGSFMLMPEESKEKRKKRDAWFREQADREMRVRNEKRRREAEREAARRLALRERDMLNDIVLGVRQENQLKISKKRKQSGASVSIVAGAEKDVVLPDKSPPPPSALSKAWSTLKKGTGRMLLTRKSTYDLRDMAEKMALPAPPLTERGDSSNTFTSVDEDSDDSIVQEKNVGPEPQSQEPAVSGNGQVRHLTAPSRKEKKLSQEEMWDLLSIRPPKRRPSESPLLLLVTGHADRPASAGMQFPIYQQLGPISPPPMSPLPPLPPSRTASRSTEVDYNVEEPEHGNDHLLASDDDQASSDFFDEFFREACRPETPSGELHAAAEPIASSPESHVAEGSRRGRGGSLMQRLEAATQQPTSSPEIESFDSQTTKEVTCLPTSDDKEEGRVDTEKALNDVEYEDEVENTPILVKEEEEVA